jgi:hypothetical protein
MNQNLTQVVLAFGDVPSFVGADVEGPYNNAELADIWIRWVAELASDSIARYDLTLVAPANWTMPEEAKAWRNVKRFPENNRIRKWPQGPNATFKQVMWFYYHGKLSGPMFWVEADCIPVKKDWLELIAEEYKRGDKPFMGAIVEAKIDPQTKQRIPRHMTGKAVYPEKAYLLAPRVMEAITMAWDVLSAEQVLPKCHPTDLIQHEWRHPEIRSYSELRSILKPNTALFHSDKYGAIAQILRKPSPEEQLMTQALPEPMDMPLSLADVPLELILEHIRAMAELSPSTRKQIAHYMVGNDIINQGHLTAYKRNKKVPSEAEFARSLKSRKDAASVTS